MDWKRDFDDMMKSALTQNVEPDAGLQRKVLAQWKEKQNMKHSKRWTVAVAGAACVLALTVSVGAATRYLSSSKVADEMGYEKLASAFSGEDAIEVNRTKSCGKYQVTFLGVTGGKALQGELADDVTKDKTYAVVAIERTDGKPMSEEEDFFVTPLIDGYKPWQYNAASMNGGCTWDVIDGVQYRIVECDSVQWFANHKLHLGVTDGFINSGMFDYDEKTGAITVNEDYEGINLLFDLPLDAAKADSRKAQEYLKELGMETETTDDAELSLTEEAVEYMQSGAWKDDIEGAAQVISPEKVTKEKSGAYELPYHIKEEDGSELEGILYFYDWQFVDGISVQKSETVSESEQTEKKQTWIAVAEKNEDGSITVSMYEK